MRFQSLELLAFGPFTDTTLDLSAPGLQLVYGPNEAGKSTARRALQALLFGIPERTLDAHTHPMTALRVGARLRAADGHELDVVRRKGRKNTLLDPGGEVLDEARLAALLRGVSAERFESSFCLDHELLRRGGEHLRLALGDVGESLFDASLGGRGVHQVLARLKAEADGLFSPRASKPPLNRALKAFKEAGQRRRELELTSSAYKTALREQRELGERRDGLRTRLDDLGAELRRLRRAEALLPLLSQHAELRRQRDVLGELPALDDDAPARRQAAEDARREAAAAGEVHGAEVARLREQLAALDDGPRGERLDPGELEALTRALARHATAHDDRPKLEQRLGQQQHELALALERLGGDHDPEQAGALVLDAELVRRIRALAQRRGGLQSGRDSLRRRVEQLEQRLVGLSEDAPVVPATETREALGAALALVDGLGDVADRAARQASQRRAAQARREQAFAALDPRGADAATTVGLEVPEREVLQAFAEERAALERRQQQLAERRAAAQARQDELGHELALVQAAGEMPERATLEAVRARRDALWAELKAGADVAGPTGERFERSQAEADGLADRLVLEAERVERWQVLQAESAQAATRLETCADDERQWQQERDAHERQWSAAWQAAGLSAGVPAERLEWRRAWAELGQAVAAEQAALAEERDYTERLEAVAEQLVQALESAAAEVPEARGLSADQRLTSLASRARAQAAALDERRREAARHAEDQAAAEVELRGARAELVAAEDGLTAWTTQWAQALGPVGLAPETTPEQAEQHLDRREAVSRAWEKRSDSGQRLAGMDADDAALAERLGRLEASWEAADPGQALEPRARALLAWQDELAERQRRSDDLRARLTAAEQALAASQRAQRVADERLAQACAAAGCERPEQLPAVEQAVGRARELERRLDELAAQLAVAGDGAPLDALREACAGLELREVKAALIAHEEQLQGLTDELRQVEDALVGVNHRLEQQQGPTAADLAVEAQGHLAEIRSGARRWATLRLATVLLEQQIERFREEHQGPVLERVAELFPRLTDGRYQRVRAEAGDDDEPRLVVSRSEGEWLGVDALSDGTRDQLFLALKVASLERQALADEPFPLVVDDVLVHFDDRRTALALEVLGELTRSTQVLLFTHHERVAELARASLPGELLVEHRLGTPG